MASTSAAFIRALLLSVAVIVVPAASAAGGTIGVNYGRVADNLPSPCEVVNLLMNNNVTHVKIYDADQDVLSAFSDTGISLIVALPNEQLLQAANNQSFTDGWVDTYIRPVYPATNITAIAVGNEVIMLRPDLNDALVPAMRNLHSSLQRFEIDSDIKVSSPFPYNIMNVSFPPSNGSFQPDLIDPVIIPLLNFLDETSSYFMINIFPYFAYSNDPVNIPLDYALFSPSAKGFNDSNGLHYSNLFEAQLDALYFALHKCASNNRRLGGSTRRRGLLAHPAGGKDHVVITETGWPSLAKPSHKKPASEEVHKLRVKSAAAALAPCPGPTTPDDMGANKQNAATYNGNLVNRVLCGKGTPYMPHKPLEVYIFGLFNENKKEGDIEKNFGLFYPDEQKVYNISLTATC